MPDGRNRLTGIDSASPVAWCLKIGWDGPMSKTRIPLPSAQEVYRVAGIWRDHCLIGDQALFSGTDGRTAAVGVEVVDALSSGVDDNENNFLGRLRSQLSGASAQARDLVAELLYVHLLVARSATVGEQQKRKIVETVLRLNDPGLSIPEEFGAALKSGLINPGQGFNTFRWRHLRYLARVFTSVKQQPRTRRAQDLAGIIAEVDHEGAWIQCYALEHLLFPDERSPVVSREHRSVILDRWGRSAGSESEQLARITESLEPNIWWGDTGFVHFYRSPYVWQWQSPGSRWTTFAQWAERMLDSVDLRANEREYKLATAAELARVKDSFGSDDWRAALTKVLRSTNVVGWRERDAFTAWLAKEPDAEDVIAALWRDSGPTSIDRFRARLPVTAAPHSGAFVSIAAFLLAAVDPVAFPPWRATLADAAFRRSGFAKPEPTATDGERYAVYLVFLDQVRDLMGRVGKPLDDRLDAQGVVWALLNYPPPESWSPQEREGFQAWRGDKPNRPVDPDGAQIVHGEGQETDERSSADLAKQLHLPESFLDEIEELLIDRGQVAFQGPPGTGKTYVAKQLARHIAGSSDRVRMVQFHASYSYEDFVEGYRPEPGGGFRRVDGPLLEWAEQARANPTEKYVLIVDELNRANVPRVFGELYYLLEYRSEPARLLYGHSEFRLPENLYLIATMNTADRSVALLDSALRRRFYFIDFRPDVEPVSGVLDQYLASRHPHMTWVAKVVAKANELLNDPDVAIGPSHFMRDGLDEKWVRRAWDHAVLPVLRDHFHGTPGRMSDFELATLRKQVDPSGAASDIAGVDAE
ncbi:AAA family ATPase [Actinokineospora fastidiosa]|uniref:AAA+ ATPase domain-containing protein n=1 Tax=Actinokineospora fastidiosa TaxID=1816 RepID=A0A918G2M8_9PSEU|nr:AAA family ATPase [Actinokineospora fastidiosa]GGS14469.1 hypothetical protein GCM10010171_02940 [Actinokineospora fastidiosa]